MLLYYQESVLYPRSEMVEPYGLGSQSVTAAQFLQERMLGSQQQTPKAMYTRPTVKESNKTDSPVSRQQEQVHGVSKVGFWNIMALAGA